MPVIKFEGKVVKVGCKGHLVRPDDWSKELAIHFAEQDGVKLKKDHWRVINFLRDYYKKFQIQPMIKIFVREVGRVLGQEKGNTEYLYKLFPGGPLTQGCKYAGLPRPIG